MTKVTFILALVALGLGGFVAFEACERGERLADLEDSVRDVQDSLASLDGKLDRLLAGTRRGDPVVLTADGPSSDGAETGLALSSRSPSASPAERLAALEQTVAKQRETISEIQDDAKKRTSSSQRFMRPDSFYRNIDAAAKSMELSERQKTDMQDSIDRAKRELADLYDLENDTGETWNSIRKKSTTTVGGSEGGFQIFMPDFGKIQKFKKSKVPGTSETFGQAQDRIKKRAFADMRRGLTPAQAKKWDGAHKAPLLNDASGGGSVMFSMTTEETEK